MRFTNMTMLPASWTMGFERNGRELLVVVAKATYVLPRLGESALLAAEQMPLIEADQFTGEPGFSAPLRETDYAHRKPACDVLLIGSAHGPNGTRVARTVVGLKVGAMVKQFAVVGERRWRRQIMGLIPSNPQPFTTIPISYDHAYGGTDRTEEAKGRADTFLLNPVGRGYVRSGERIEGELLPNTEELGRPVESVGTHYMPMAFSPIGRNWSPRAAFVGTYDQQWIENTAPLWPVDFDPRYFQAAPPDQMIDYPQGGEEVVLRNLTADGHRAFRLPAWRMPVTFIPHRGKDLTQQAVVDTLVFEPDIERFTATWRICLPLGRSMFDVKETIIGEMPAAWHRARRFPGKTYYSGLGALVAQKKGKR